MRSAVAARFLTLRVLTDSTFPPLTRLSGQSPSQEVNAGAPAKHENRYPGDATKAAIELYPVSGKKVTAAAAGAGHLGSTGQHKFLCCSVDQAKVLSGTRVRDRSRREDGSSGHQEGGGRQEEVKENEYLPGCGPNGPRVEGGAVEVAAV